MSRACARAFRLPFTVLPIGWQAPGSQDASSPLACLHLAEAAKEPIYDGFNKIIMPLMSRGENISCQLRRLSFTSDVSPLGFFPRARRDGDLTFLLAKTSVFFNTRVVVTHVCAFFFLSLLLLLVFGNAFVPNEGNTQTVQDESAHHSAAESFMRH